MSEIKATLEAAVERLSALADETVETGKISPELQHIALLLVAPCLRILRVDVQMYNGNPDEDTVARMERATERAGDLAMAKAILSVSS